MDEPQVGHEGEPRNDVERRLRKIELQLMGDPDDGIAIPGILGVINELDRKVEEIVRWKNRVMGGIILMNLMILVFGVWIVSRVAT